MRLNPPKLVVDEKEPFKGALFDREAFGKSLTNLLLNISDNLVVFVNAPWGAGKTTFSEMWRAYLKQQKHEVIYFDAYAADYFDDPFVSFSGEILDLVDKRLNEGKGLIERREFQKTAVELGKRLAGLVTKVGLKAATMGAVDATHLKELKEIGTEIASGVSEIGADIIEKKIENYAAEKESLENFKKSLTKLAAKVREEQGFPLTIIIDELDRCRPDFALGLLERIKHLFDVEGVAFVLLVNRGQIEGYIETIYGNKNDAAAYLQKFGAVFIDLPGQEAAESSFVYINGHGEYCSSLINHFGFAKKVRDVRFLTTCATNFAKHFDLTLREVDRVFAVLTLYYGSLNNNQFTAEFLVALLSILKIKLPLVYQSLKRGSLSVEKFYEVTHLEKLFQKEQENMNGEWAKDFIDYCLMSEADFEKATKAEAGKNPARYGLFQMIGMVRMNRLKIIPFLCSRLDQFSFSS